MCKPRWWLGYQHCYMPCESPDIDVPGECGQNLIWPVGKCDAVNDCEQFFNCAGEGGGGPCVGPSAWA